MYKLSIYTLVVLMLGSFAARANNASSAATTSCGEHDGDPDSVKFCHKLGMNYVSCSPSRVPVVRLAAAHAALEEKGV